MGDKGPVILIGAARSGTKFLRDVLAQSDDLAKVPYDINYIWRYGAEDTPDDRLDPSGLTRKRADFIRAKIAKLARVRHGQRILEKTVSNALRVPFVAAVYPNARFVHLIRDGQAVTPSALRMWQARPNWRALLVKLRQMPLANLRYVFWFATNTAKGLVFGRSGGRIWGPRFVGIDDMVQNKGLAEICAWQWRYCVTLAQNDLAQLSPDRVHILRYEDLVSDPGALRDLIRWLGLSDGAVVESAWQARVNLSVRSRIDLLPEVELRSVMRILAPARAQIGYE